METRLMRIVPLVIPLALITLALMEKAQADGRCDLNDVVGYQVVFAKPVDGYIQSGLRKKGYEGCEPDRVLVFADNTGVRCKQTVRQHLDELPTAYLFARSQSDMKLCIEGELIDVSQTN